MPHRRQISVRKHLTREICDIPHLVTLHNVGTRRRCHPIIVENLRLEDDRAGRARTGWCWRWQCGGVTGAAGWHARSKYLGTGGEAHRGELTGDIEGNRLGTVSLERRRVIGRIKTAVERRRLLGEADRRCEGRVELLPIGEQISDLKITKGKEVTHLEVERVLNRVTSPGVRGHAVL